MKRESIKIGGAVLVWPPFGELHVTGTRLELYRDHDIAIFRSGSSWHTVAAAGHKSQWRGVVPRLLLKQRTRRMARLVARFAVGDDKAAEQWVSETVSEKVGENLQARWHTLAAQTVSLVRERYETR